METHHEDKIDFNNISFWMNGQTFYLSSNALNNLALVYKIENLDRILDTLQDENRSARNTKTLFCKKAINYP